MPGTVTLTFVNGKLKGKAFPFDERSICIIGRASDCNLKLPSDKDHETISRYHCLLDINPPHIRIRDFGSHNGTFVNGEKIGQRSKDQPAQGIDRDAHAEFDLQHGDAITLGATVMRVQIESLAETVSVPVEPSPETHGLAPSGTPASPAQRGEDTPGPAMPAVPGFTMLRKLGEGGMARVYLARDERTGEELAVKIMLPQVAADEMARGMFLREVKNTEVLRHPNVVALRDSGCLGDNFYFTLEYCNAGSVHALMDIRDGTLSIDEATTITLQALDGLEYAHNVEISATDPESGTITRSRGLVHRDLKPGNIYLSETDGKLCAKVGDFGLSKAFDLAGLSGQTDTGCAIGTPLYMPRQQILDYKYAKPEVDVWAMAATFYKMVTGSTPRSIHRGDDPWLVALNNAAIPIRERAAEVPAALARVIDEALIDKPTLRFESAGKLKRAIEAAL
jgi:pSer/pThr/pTyr-binding forkhead associated (FHA) protein